ncbi:MAG: peptidase [Cellvibrionaceae bacterium]
MTITSNGVISVVLVCLSFGLLSACGGGSSSGSAPVSTTRPVNQIGNANNWQSGVFAPASDFINLCENPRIGIDPTTSNNYPDEQGTTTDENNWLRSMTNDLYLWYDEVPDVNPALYSSTEDYFDLLVTDATTPSGAFKDQFHFTYPSEEWFNITQGGVSAGYGAEFALIRADPPREIVVAYTQPNSPATDVGITRGARVISVDGEPVSTGDTDILNAAVFPDEIGVSHQFEIQDLGSTTRRVVTMVSQDVTTIPVQNVKTISTATGNVGYLTFNDHIATAEQGLIDAVNQLAADNISDLVIDLRYNRGGFLYIASQLSYMIAGPANTAGKDFERLVFNDKHPSINPVTGRALGPRPFYNATSASQPTGLPTLNLNRVFILSGSDTCSASESIINGLRGIDIDVYQIGTTTCGKPYGFYEMPNCGTSYFTIMFRGDNAKGFGDYADGFAPQNTIEGVGTLLPGCTVADDFTHQLGDENERKLAGALSYRAQLESTGTASCNSISTFPAPIISGLAKSSGIDLSAVNARLPKPKGIEGRILR